MKIFKKRYHILLFLQKNGVVKSESEIKWVIFATFYFALFGDVANMTRVFFRMGQNIPKSIKSLQNDLIEITLFLKKIMIKSEKNIYLKRYQNGIHITANSKFSTYCH